MNKIERGKSWLLTFGIICALLAIATTVGGVMLLLFSVKTATVKVVWLVVAILLLVFSLVLIPFAITFIWSALSLTATKGNIKEGNLAKGTVNMNKCQKCGTELEPKTNVCPKCSKKD